MKSYISFAIFGCLLLTGCSATNAVLKPPAGLRPCCAFGTDLQAKFLNIPVPFFKINNMLDQNHLGNHLYNDGSQPVLKQLFDWSEEKNGLVCTQKGGFIDIAHVRDTADYTFYLFKQMPNYLGSGKSLSLPAELRNREIFFPKNETRVSINEQIKLAGLIAFRLAQWHEIAQWFGYESAFSIPETVSAFSPEDLYSNMLGAIIAMQVLRGNPQMDKEQFATQFQQQLSHNLIALGIVDKETATEKIKALDGTWWDSHKRLPDKWLVLKRSYNLALTITPNWVIDGQKLSLSDNLNLEDLLELHLIKNPKVNEKGLKNLPANLYKKVFTTKDFQELANFAKKEDEIKK